jgi:hypothetical protein
LTRSSLLGRHSSQRFIFSIAGSLLLQARAVIVAVLSFIPGQLHLSRGPSITPKDPSEK